MSRSRPPAPPPARPAPPWLAPAGLIALAVLAHAGVLTGGWIWDDPENVTRCAPVLASWDGLRTIWLDPTAIQQYYPMVHTTFWIEHQLWGLHPLGFHAVNLALHTLAALLLWRLLRRLGLPDAAAWIGAALFAVHPVHVESVAWVTERKNTLSMALALGSALAWLRWAGLAADGARGEGTRRAWLTAFGLFVLALLAKSVTATLPLALLIVAWWKRGRLDRRDASLAPFFAASLVFALLTIHLERENVGVARLALGFDPLQRVLLAGHALAFYAGKLVLPIGLSFVYPRERLDPAALASWMFPLGAVVAAVALLALARRAGRGPLAAYLTWIALLAPMLGFFDLWYFRYSLVSDHFQYHASVAPLALLGLGLARLHAALDRRVTGAGAALVGALLLALVALSEIRTSVFHDEHSLWTDTVRHNPDAWLAWNNLGRLALDAGRPDQAEPMVRRALAIDSTAHEAWNNLGICAMEAGRPAEGIAAFERSVTLHPGYHMARENLGRALLVTGQPERAVEVLKAGTTMTGHDPAVDVDLVEALIRSGRLAEAESACRVALAKAPGDPRLGLLYGRLLRHRGAIAEALRVLEDTVARTHRRDPVALDALATTLAAAGRAAEASRVLEEALALHAGSEADAVLRAHLEAVRRGEAPR